MPLIATDCHWLRRAGVLLLADSGGAAGALAAYLDAHHAAGAAQQHTELWGSTYSTADPAEALAGYEGGRWLVHVPLLQSICALDELSGTGPMLASYRIGATGANTALGTAAADGGGGGAGGAGQTELPLDLAILRAMLARHEGAAAEATAARVAASGMGPSGGMDGGAGAPLGRRRGVRGGARLGARLTRGQSKWMIEKPVRLAVQWGRADVMRELLGKMYAREDEAAAAAAAAAAAGATSQHQQQEEERLQMAALAAAGLHASAHHGATPPPEGGDEDGLDVIGHRPSVETVLQGDPASAALEAIEMRSRPAAEAVAEAVQCALQCALEQRRVDIVALLLSHRASLSQVRPPGRQPRSDPDCPACTRVCVRLPSAALGVPSDRALLCSRLPSCSPPQVNLPALYTCASVSEATAAALATSASLTALRTRPINVRSRSAEEQRQLYEEGVLPFLVALVPSYAPPPPPPSSSPAPSAARPRPPPSARDGASECSGWRL